MHKKNYYGYCPNFLNEINSINLNLTFFEDDKIGPGSNIEISCPEKNETGIYFLKAPKSNENDDIKTYSQISQIADTSYQTDIMSTTINKTSISISTLKIISTISTYMPNNSFIPLSEILEQQEEIKILNLSSFEKNDIMENIEKIMDNTIIGETYEYQNNELSILIYPTDSKLLTNKTHINFMDCESLLKFHHNLSNDSIITFFQMEISNKNDHSLTNQVEYQVFDEQKNQLDLSVCNNSKINIFYGIKNNSNLDVTLINSFKDNGINIFNISDDFFNDVCYPYTDNGKDIILEDRIKDIYQNFTLCEEGCSFEDIDIFNMLIACQCSIKENMTTIIKEIKEEAAEKISSLNFEIAKCYNLAFSMEGKMNNIGFWILSFCFLLHIIFLIIYSCNGIKPVKDYIFNEMTKYGYINPSANRKKNDTNGNNGKNNEKIQRKKNNYKNFKQQKTGINNPPIKLKNSKKEKQYKKSIRLNLKRKTQKGKKDSIINNINVSNQFFINNNNNNNLQKSNNLNLNLISINLSDINKKNLYSLQESNITLYNYTMEEAFKYDRRNYCIIFYIYFLSKQAFFHAFLYRSPLEIFPLRFCLLLFIISSDLALNALFYFNDNISRKYRYTKNIFFSLLSII